MAAETKTLLGCFQLAPGVDEELQTKTVKLTAATAVLSGRHFGGAITTFVQNGFSGSLISPLLASPSARAVSSLTPRDCHAKPRMHGHRRRRPLRQHGLLDAWYCGLMVGSLDRQTWCSQYNCDAQFVNGTECVIAAAGGAP